jgi:hypothetical protein
MSLFSKNSFNKIVFNKNSFQIRIFVYKVWVKFVKDILNNCGLSNVWIFQNINFNTEWVIAYVKLRLRDHLLQEWNSNLENSPKALNYGLYKQIFEFENYFY